MNTIRITIGAAAIAATVSVSAPAMAEPNLTIFSPDMREGEIITGVFTGNGATKDVVLKNGTLIVTSYDKSCDDMTITSSRDTYKYRVCGDGTYNRIPVEVMIPDRKPKSP